MIGREQQERPAVAQRGTHNHIYLYYMLYYLKSILNAMTGMNSSRGRSALCMIRVDVDGALAIPSGNLISELINNRALHSSQGGL